MPARKNFQEKIREISDAEDWIQMIKALSGETDADSVEQWMEKQQVREEDEVTVCELFDQYVRQGRKEGIAAGREEGIKTGKLEGIKYGEARRLVEDIESTMRFFHVTLEKACESLGTTVGRYEEAKRLI